MRASPVVASLSAPLITQESWARSPRVESREYDKEKTKGESHVVVLVLVSAKMLDRQ